MPNLRIAELDFDTIKSNLKTFLQSQSEFTDYDFEGSSLSVLIDILAYNTHYNAYLANMLINEMFLDSAVKRASAVSIAKHLGYTPRSTKSARAVLNVTVNNAPGNPATITLDRYTPFTVSLNGTAFTFYNLQPSTVTKLISGEYVFSNLEVVEGTPLSISYVVANPGPEEKFEIPSPTVDTSTLLVTVQTSATNTFSSAYVISDNIANITSNSRVYFLEENPFEKYQVYFGDDVTGKKLTVGNIVTIRYLSSLAQDANSSNLTTQTFTTTSIAGSSNVTISTVTNPRGGSPKETIGSIKFNAPRSYAARNRAVTSSDYETLISSNFLDAESVSVWGGEENDPPYYGKVLISLKPYYGFTISQATKDSIIETILKDKKVLSIQPEFIDPDYGYVNLKVYITYDSNTTTKTSSQIENIVRNTVTNYFSTQLQKFNKNFNKSFLINNILNSDSSIQSVLITIKLQKRFNVTLNKLNSFYENDVIKFQNAILPGSLTSTRFLVNFSNTTVSSKIVDIPNTMPPDNLGNGTLRLVNAESGSILESNVGTVNYGTGLVNIFGITPIGLPNNLFDFRVTGTIQETNHNLQVSKNEILVLDDSDNNAFAGLEAGLTVNVTAS